MSSLLIKNGHIIDPANGISEVGDVLVRDGKISEIKGNIDTNAEIAVDAAGKLVAPGFIDLHVHFREPGFEHKETIATGAASAARGGFTTVCCMANTNPVVDNAVLVKFIRQKAAGIPVNLLQFGAATRGMLGAELAELEGMAKAGIAGISEDGKTVANAGLYLKILIKAKELGLTVYSHCEELTLINGGVPAIAEDIIIARDIMLAEEAGANLHICHLSTEGGVRLVREAKARGVKVTCEVAPHHLFLTRADIPGEDTNYKMSPPLRRKEDAAVLRKALREGVIDCIATDHAPHSAEDKSCGWFNAANGVTGLETAYPVCFTKLVKTGFMSDVELIERLSTNPARILGINKGSLTIGSDADIVIIDQEKKHIINAADFASMGKNTPWSGREVCGDVDMTILGGKVVYKCWARR
ncbi:MAG: dihydroorotase [Defluviitaleaceae bacterium]|nr:dihydroorotase [Defluviitaleaceae bacterium]MCL2835484.1 dihydroorotase [Defluviitaleaceae bacterium]